MTAQLSTVSLVLLSTIMLLSIGSSPVDAQQEDALGYDLSQLMRFGSPQLRHYLSRSRFLRPYGPPGLPASFISEVPQFRLSDDDLMVQVRERKSNNLRNLMRIGKRSGAEAAEDKSQPQQDVEDAKAHPVEDKVSNTAGIVPVQYL